MPQAPHVEARPGSYPVLAGVDAKMTEGRLGHSNFSTTMNIYTHFQQENDRRVRYRRSRQLEPK